MEIAGHSDIRLTLNVYTHAGDDAKRAAIDEMDCLFAAQ
jgi:integrase